MLTIDDLLNVVKEYNNEEVDYVKKKLMTLLVTYMMDK